MYIYIHIYVYIYGVFDLVNIGRNLTAGNTGTNASGPRPPRALSTAKETS